jgi:hypothetical protein
MKRRTDQQLRSKLARSNQKRRKQLLASLAAAGVAGAASLAHADTATTLTGVTPTVTNDAVPLNHGSNAEVTLTWALGGVLNWDQYADWNGRGDVYQIEFPPTYITFEPTAPSIKITVQDFFLDEWAGGTDTAAIWSVTGSVSGLLASGTWNDFNNANDPADAGGRSLVTANATGLPGETLTLNVDHAGGYVSYLAMDNLTFLSMIVVPEPTTVVLAWGGVGGLGALSMRRKRS